MKRLRSLTAVLLIISLLFSFTGCSLRFSSFENLMRPPKLIGKYQGLQDAFEKSVSQEFTLLTPSNGDFQSSFLTYDIDSDGEDEALVFYMLNETHDIAKVAYFEYIDSQWKYVSSQDGLGNAVDKVIINDLNKDGAYEVYIGWSMFSSKSNKAFSEYILKTDSFEQKASYPYSYFDVVDVNGDGYTDVISLYVDSSVPDKLSATARVYNYDRKSESLLLFGETPLDGNISSYSKFVMETVNDINYIYIEANKGLNESITEVIYWDAITNKLVSPLFDISSQSTILTWRNMYLWAYDIDGDKYLEIPTSVEMPGSMVTVTDDSNTSSTVTSDNNPITKLYFTKWVKFRNGRLIPVQYSIVNNILGYMVNIRSTWVGKITVSGNDGQWDYYRWNSSAGNSGDLLFSIYAYNNNDSETKELYSELEVLKATSSKTYVYRITASGERFGINKDWLESNFILSEFGG